MMRDDGSNEGEDPFCVMRAFRNRIALVTILGTELTNNNNNRIEENKINRRIESKFIES